MANALIEGVVPLAGLGFVAKSNGNFQSGEYKRLCNLELDSSGVLVNRRNIYSINGETPDVAVSPFINPQRFLGSMGEYALITVEGSDDNAASTMRQFAVGENTSTELWSTLTPVPSGGANSYGRFLGYFRYNNADYWIVLEHYDAVNEVVLSLYHAAVPAVDVLATYAPGYEASLTRTVIFTFTGNDHLNFEFYNFFLFKERLWFSTSLGLYFSKATDPTIFTVPDGGFFRYPNNNINWAFAIKDIIYVLCANAVYALTYNTDPNTDSTQRALTETVGGEMGCIHVDTPYFINNLGIFSIVGNSVEKVMDNRFDYGENSYSNRIYSFEEYLVVVKYTRFNYDEVTSTTGKNRNPGSKFEPFLSGNSLGYNVYFINVDNGATHVVDFLDQYSEFNHGGAGFVVDALVNANSDASGNYKLFLLTNKYISTDGNGLHYKGCVYYLSSSNDVEVNDYVVNSADVLKRRAPKIDLDIDSYVPDGVEYRIKKFRSMLLQGSLSTTLILWVGYDNTAAINTFELGDDPSVFSFPRPHYGHRFGLNQRGHSISFRLFNDLWNDELLEPLDRLEISDLRVMWTYTQRLPVTKNIGS